MTKKIYNIEDCIEPMRLDRYLRLQNKNFTQGFIEKSIRKGDLKLNHKKTSSNIRVQNGDIIELYMGSHIEMEEELKQAHPGAKELADKLLSKYLIFENEDFLVLNKPSGIASQGGSNVALSIDDALSYLNQKFCPDDRVDKGYRLVHRLDRETSGVFLVAKHRNAATKLAKAFEEKIIQKKYLAVVHGIPKQLNGTVANYLSKDVREQIQKVSSRGGYAETQYQLLSKADKYSLVEFEPKTGRMHQIRVHARFLSCPIVGDEKYGPEYPKTTNLMLHARTITLSKEIFGQEYIFEADVPEYFLIKP